MLGSNEEMKNILRTYEEALNALQLKIKNSTQGLRSDSQYVPVIVEAFRAIAENRAFTAKVSSTGMSGLKKLPDSAIDTLRGLLVEDHADGFKKIIANYCKDDNNLKQTLEAMVSDVKRYVTDHSAVLHPNVTLYKAPGDVLAVEFNTPKEREIFLKALGSVETFPSDHPFYPNVKCPAMRAGNDTTLFFPGYKAQNGELGVTFCSISMREKFMDLLQLRQRNMFNEEPLISTYEGQNALYINNRNIHSEGFKIEVKAKLQAKLEQPDWLTYHRTQLKTINSPMPVTSEEKQRLSAAISESIYGILDPILQSAPDKKAALQGILGPMYTINVLSNGVIRCINKNEKHAITISKDAFNISGVNQDQKQAIYIGLIEKLPRASLYDLLSTEEQKTYHHCRAEYYQSLVPAPQASAAAPAPLPQASPLSSSMAAQPAPELRQLLRAPVIPPEVQAYADRGIRSYQSKGAMHHLHPVRKKGVRAGGRGDEWIKNTFDEDEDAIVATFRTIPPPPTFTTGQIEQIAQAVGPASMAAQRPNFHIVQGVSANYLHDAPSGSNAICQLASQADFNEATYPADQPVSIWHDDNTQGPQASIEAAAGAMHRKAAKKNGLHALEQLLVGEFAPDKIPDLYQHGYLQLGALNEDQKERFLAHLQKNINQLKILPHWVQCEASGAHQLQVCAFAPSFQGQEEPPDPTSVDHQICRLLVVAQYKAIAELAVIRARETGERVPLHLTLVGQGVFNNRPEVMADAMKAVADTVRGANVEVFVHAFGPHDVSKIVAQLDNIQDSVSYNKMTAQEFTQRPHPAASQPHAVQPPPAYAAAPAPAPVSQESSRQRPVAYTYMSSLSRSSGENKTTPPVADSLAPAVPGAKRSAPYLAKDDAEATKNCLLFIQAQGFVHCIQVINDRNPDPRKDRGYAFCFGTEQEAKNFAAAIADANNFSGGAPITNATGGQKMPFQRPDGTYSISIDRPYVNGVASGHPLSQIESLRNFKVPQNRPRAH